MTNTEPTAATRHILRIQDLLDGWRALGSRRLPDGVELIARVPDVATETWLHAVFPAATAATLQALERAIGGPVPVDLRTFYRCLGGLSLFAGLFELRGYRVAGVVPGDGALRPSCVVALNHELDALGWKQDGAVAFAENRWDMSVYVVGGSGGERTVSRCERGSGRVIETHPDVLACVADRLSRLEQMVVREPQPRHQAV